jgi:hypothetical protein
MTGKEPNKLAFPNVVFFWHRPGGVGSFPDMLVSAYGGLHIMTGKTLGKLFFYVASASVLIIFIALNVYPAEFVGQERMIFGFSVMIASVGVIARLFGMTYRLAMVAASIGAAAFFCFPGHGPALELLARF